MFILSLLLFLFFLMIRRPPRSTLFPYTSSSDLVRRHRRARFGQGALEMRAVGFPDFPRLLAERRQRTRGVGGVPHQRARSEEHTSELQSQSNLVCRLLLEKKKK